MFRLRMGRRSLLGRRCLLLAFVWLLMQRVWSYLLTIKLDMVWLMVVWVSLVAVVMVRLLLRTIQLEMVC